MKKIVVLLPFLILSAISYGQKPEDITPEQRSILELMADSIVEARMNYFIEQMGGRMALEAFYERSIESISEEFTPLILDSLIRLEGIE